MRHFLGKNGEKCGLDGLDYLHNYFIFLYSEYDRNFDFVSTNRTKGINSWTGTSDVQGSSWNLTSLAFGARLQRRLLVDRQSPPTTMTGMTSIIDYSLPLHCFPSHHLACLLIHHEEAEPIIMAPPPKRVKKVMTLPINVIFSHLQVRWLARDVLVVGNTVLYCTVMFFTSLKLTRCNVSI